MEKGESARACLRKALSSRLTLMIAISFSVNLLLSIVNAFIPIDYLAFWEELFSIDLREYFQFFMWLSSIQGSLALVGLAVPVFLCIVLWVLYLVAKTKEKIPVAGLQLVKIATIIQFIFLWITIACLMVVFFIVLVVALEEAILVAIGLSIELILLLELLPVLLIFLFFKMKNMLNGAMKVAKTNLPNHTVSWFWIICFYIFGGFCITFSVPLLFLEVQVGIQTLCSAIFFALSATGLVKYKREMDALCPRRVYRVVVPKSQIIFYDNVKN